MKRLAFLLLGTWLSAAAAAPTSQIADYGTTDPIQLDEIAFDSYSEGTKARIRSYLRETVPDTPEGMMARAWLASQDGDALAGQALYRECISRFPAALGCRYNLATATPDLGEKRQLLQALVAEAPAFNDYAPVRNLYFFLLDDLKDEKAASAVLAEQERRAPGHAVFDFIRGLKELTHEKDNDQAAHLFRVAVAKNQLRRSEALEKLLGLETGPLFKGGGDRLDRALAIVRDYYANTSSRNRAPLYYLLKRFGEGPNDWSRRALILQLAWLTTGKHEAAEWEPEILRYVDPVLWAYAPSLADRVYDEIGKYGQSSPQRLWAGRSLLFRDVDTKLSMTLYWEGIRSAYSEKQRRKAAIQLMDDLQTLNKCRLGDDFAKEYLAQYPPDANFYSQYFELNLCNGDLSAAAVSLGKRRSLGEIDNSTLREDELRLEQARAERESSMIPLAEQRPVLIPRTNVLALSPDGRLLALGTDPIRLVDTTSTNLLGNMGKGTRYRFTVDGRHLVTLGEDGLSVREVASGRVVGQALHRDSQNFRDFALDPNGKRLAATDFRGHLYRYTLPDLRLEKERIISEKPLAAYVAWLRDGDIVTASATETGLRLWAADTLRPHGHIPSVRVPWVHALEASPSGRYLAAIDNASELHLWDTRRKGGWGYRHMEATFAGQIAFSPKEDAVIVNQWDGGGLALKIPLDTLYPQVMVEGINAHHAFNPDGDVVYRADGGLEELEADTLDPVKYAGLTRWRTAPTHRALQVYPELGVYAITEDQRTHFHSIEDDRRVRIVDARLNLDRTGAPPGRFSGQRDGQYFFYDYASDSLTKANDLHGDLDLSTDFSVRIGKSGDRPSQFQVEFFKAGEKEAFAQAELPAATEDLVYGTEPADIGYGSVIDGSGRYWIVRTWWQDGFGRSRSHSRLARVFELSSGKLVKTIELPNGIRYLLPHPQNPDSLLIQTAQATYPLSLSRMELGTLLPLTYEDRLLVDDAHMQVSYRPEAIRILDRGDGSSRLILPPHGGRFASVAALTSDSFLIVDDQGETQSLDFKAPSTTTASGPSHLKQ